MTPTRLRQQLTARIDGYKAAGGYRSLPTSAGEVDFCSNDYLGLARESVSALAAESGAMLRPSGSSGSRLVSGNSSYLEEVESAIARFHGVSSALLFTSGYLANISLVSSLTERHDTIIYDQLIHASLRDGIQLSRSRSFGFRHNDLEDLRAKLQLATGAIAVVVEALYSMDGDRAPLREIVALAEEFGAEVVVDEAHSVGIDGHEGRGLVCALGLQSRVLARTVTFGKALGCHGAAVLSGGEVRETIINRARGFIFTTAMSPRSAADIQAAYRRLPELDQRRIQLASLSEKLRKLLPDSVAEPESTPIHRVIVPGNEEVSRVAQELSGRGFSIVAIRAPTVPEGSERLRICLHSYNSEDELHRLCSALREVCIEPDAAANAR